MKNIAIIAGGNSSEYEVSMKSGKNIYDEVDENRYNKYLVILKGRDWHVEIGEKKYPVDRNDFSFTRDGEKILFDFAYITIHGVPGENGLLQGYLDMMGVPYGCCNVLASALTFDKHTCNTYLKSYGVNVADSVMLIRGMTYDVNEIINEVGLPCFVKPNAEGSSFGVTKVKEASAIQPAIAKAFSEGREVVIESFIDGTEVTCGCYKTADKEVVFPLTEVVTDNEFFDFDAKYNGQVQEITPARVSVELTEKVQRETSRIYDILGAKGLIRVDYIIPAGGEPKLLEVNTTPGMTATSFIPQQVRAAGLEMKDVMTDIIENEFN